VDDWRSTICAISMSGNFCDAPLNAGARFTRFFLRVDRLPEVPLFGVAPAFGRCDTRRGWRSYLTFHEESLSNVEVKECQWRQAGVVA
jgi:hypothetical protein